LDELYKSIDSSIRNEVFKAAEIQLKYSGYIDRESVVAEKLLRLENVQIGDKFDYEQIDSLSTEARQKLDRIRPETIGQASRIPGVSPSDINVLLVLLGR
jgi:tRNA uridine 5-carboxymethylaminomethyl modification enzyme